MTPPGRDYTYRGDDRDDSRRYPPSSHRTSHRSSRSQSPRARSPQHDSRQEICRDGRSENIMKFFRPVLERAGGEPSSTASSSRHAAASIPLSSQSTSYSRDTRGRDDSRDRDRRSFRGSGGRGRDRRGRGGFDNRGRDRDHNRDRDRDRDGRHSRNTVPRAAYPPGQRDMLRADAKETLQILPTILNSLRSGAKASAVFKYDPWSLPSVDPAMCPRFSRPATIRVLNSDTINAATKLQRITTVDLLSDNLVTEANTPLRPPLVVNFASHHSPGGGWRNGALAQEEALCYRSSLALSLDRGLYPLGREEILYSPYVLIMRHDRPSGHKLMVPGTQPKLLPIMSVVSVAALQRPAVRRVPINDGSHGYDGRSIWATWTGTQSSTRSPIPTEEPCTQQSSTSRHSTMSWSPSQEAVPTGPPPEYTSQPPSPAGQSPPQLQQPRSPPTGLDEYHRFSLSPAEQNGDSQSQQQTQQTLQTQDTGDTDIPYIADSPPHQALDVEKTVFAYETDLFLTKLKMRLVLRAAALAGHHQLVLGALGCGVYANPPEQVARCWLEVLREPEFTAAGHWWQDIVFAVYDGQRNQSGRVDLGTQAQADKSNYDIFHEILDGQQV